MRIAVNTGFSGVNGRGGYANFLYQAFLRITEKYPMHEFIFIHEKKSNQPFDFGLQVKNIVTGSSGNHPLLRKYWCEVKIPAILRKHKADVFVTCNGCCSLSTRVPQCLVVGDLSFLHQGAYYNKRQIAWYKKYTPRFIQKAVSVVTLSLFLKNEIVQHYNMDSRKIDVVYSGAKNIDQPVAADVKSAVKEKYTAGKEYLITAGSSPSQKNIIQLLKAFSVFKKRQQTGMKLVITGNLAKKNDAFLKSLSTYKYRQDIVVTGEVADEHWSQLLGAAYGLVSPYKNDAFDRQVLEALYSAVPVITAGDSPMQEICGAAALYADPTDYKNIADQMMLLYKDELLRKNLIEKGMAVAKEYNWERTAELLWQSIEKAATGKQE